MLHKADNAFRPSKPRWHAHNVIRVQFSSFFSKKKFKGPTKTYLAQVYLLVLTELSYQIKMFYKSILEFQLKVWFYKCRNWDGALQQSTLYVSMRLRLCISKFQKIRNILLLYNFFGIFGVFVDCRKSHGKFCYFAALYALNKRDKFSFS